MQTIRLDISQKNNVPLLYVKQRDVGHTFAIELYENGIPYSVDEENTFAVWYSGASGDGNYTTIGDETAVFADRNVITVQMIMQMLNEPGGHEMCVVMYGQDNEQKGFWNIPYCVEEIPGADSEGATEYYNAFLDAQKKAEEAAGRAEAAADRAEAGVGASIIVGIDEGEYATHTASEIYDAIQNHKTVVYRWDPRAEPSELIPIRLSTPSKAVFSKPGYPTEFDIFNIEINCQGRVSYETSFSSELVAQAVEKVKADIAPVSYLPQELNPEQQAQAQMNIGVDKLCPPFTESGSAVTCEPVEGYPLQVVSKIESVQSGSGHDMVQLTQSGKNLLAYPYVDTTKTVDGMTFTDNGDGSITLNGTSTSSYLSFILQSAPFADVLKDGVTYRLSTGTDDTNIAIVCYYKNESGASVWASGNMTWKKEYTLLQVYLQVTEVATYTNMVLYPQIEIGTTATAFEPYRGYTYTMDLGQEVFGGFLNWTTGVLTDSEGNVHQLNAQEIIALPGTNILYSSTGDTEVTGRADPAAIINNLLDRLAALEAAVVNNA